MELIHIANATLPSINNKTRLKTISVITKN
jgi:hypothetical protein